MYVPLFYLFSSSDTLSRISSIKSEIMSQALLSEQQKNKIKLKSKRRKSIEIPKTKIPEKSLENEESDEGHVEAEGEGKEAELFIGDETTEINTEIDTD